MRDLELQFEGRGEVKQYSFLQVKSSDAGYIYKLSCKETGRSHYEVFKKKINEQYNTVSYPRSKSFGIWAWCCTDFHKALSRYSKIKLEFSINTKNKS